MIFLGYDLDKKVLNKSYTTIYFIELIVPLKY